MIAELHLLKTLVKIKSIANAASFPQSIAARLEEISIPHDAAYANVTARLYNSAPVKSAIEGILSTIRGILGIENGERMRKKRLRVADFATENKVDQDSSLAVQAKDGQTPKEGGNDSDDKLLDPAQEDHSDPFGGFDSDNDLSNPEHFQSRLASSSSSATPSSSASPPPAKPPFSTEPPSASIPRPSSTTFLPSLLGGYYSGSSSQPSDDETAAGVPTLNVRRNRRGQRARREIWEQKFGTQAKHLKQGGRDGDWDARRGGGGEERRGQRKWGRGEVGGRDGMGRGGGSGGRVTGANGEALKAKEREKMMEGPLHPSWEAAKRRKEAKVGAVFEGKKVVFD